MTDATLMARLTNCLSHWNNCPPPTRSFRVQLQIISWRLTRRIGARTVREGRETRLIHLNRRAGDAIWTSKNPSQAHCRAITEEKFWFTVCLWDCGSVLKASELIVSFTTLSDFSMLAFYIHDTKYVAHKFFLNSRFLSFLYMYTLYFICIFCCNHIFFSFIFCRVCCSAFWDCLLCCLTVWPK